MFVPDPYPSVVIEINHLVELFVCEVCVSFDIKHYEKSNDFERIFLKGSL